jgi:uncharacterized protein (TIGR02391 family)
MNPVRLAEDDDTFKEIRERLNKIIAFVGSALSEDGKSARFVQVRTLPEAERRVRGLWQRLQERSVHGDVLRFRRPELLDGYYFHAALEAMKSMAEKIRTMSGLMTDGAALVNRAFGGQRPLLAINSLQTETEQSEQYGSQNILVAVFGLFRNPTIHEPRLPGPFPSRLHSIH